MFSIVVYKYHNEYGPRDNTRLMLPFITQVVQHKRILDAKGKTIHKNMGNSGLRTTSKKKGNLQK